MSRHKSPQMMGQYPDLLKNKFDAMRYCFRHKEQKYIQFQFVENLKGQGKWRSQTA